MADEISIPEGITHVLKDRSVLFVDPFFIDIRPVTFGEYAEFIKATNRQPDEAAWQKTGFFRRTFQPRGSTWDAPVTHVSLEDASAYAAFVGKRLPTYMEWVRAAQGKDTRGWLNGPENSVELAWIEFMEGSANRNRRMDRLINDYVPTDGKPAIDLIPDYTEWVSDSWHAAINEIVRRLRVAWVRPFADISHASGVMMHYPTEGEVVDMTLHSPTLTFRCARDGDHPAG